MHRFWKQTLLTLPITAMLAMPWVARAEVHKCVDAQGKITFTDGSYSPGSSQQQTNALPAKKTDSGATAAASPSDLSPSKSSQQSAARESFNSALDSRLRGLRAECSQG